MTAGGTGGTLYPDIHGFRSFVQELKFGCGSWYFVPQCLQKYWPLYLCLARARVEKSSWGAISRDGGEKQEGDLGGW